VRIHSLCLLFVVDFVSQMKAVDIPSSYNTARAPNIRADSPEVKGVVNFADRFFVRLNFQISIVLQKS
jgi:hypothetical protein